MKHVPISKYCKIVAYSSTTIHKSALRMLTEHLHGSRRHTVNETYTFLKSLHNNSVKTENRFWCINSLEQLCENSDMKNNRTYRCIVQSI